MPDLCPAAGSTGQHSPGMQTISLHGPEVHICLRATSLKEVEYESRRAFCKVTFCPVCGQVLLSAIKFFMSVFERQSLHCEMFMQDTEKLWLMHMYMCFCFPSHFSCYMLIGCLALVYWTEWRTHSGHCSCCHVSVPPLNYGTTRGLFVCIILFYLLSFSILCNKINFHMQKNIIWR